MAGMAATAAIVYYNNVQFYYSSGVFYSPYNGGYRVVPAPVSVVVTSVPLGYETCEVDGVFYRYYGGAFFLPTSDGRYQVVQAPPGALISNLPEGCEQININGVVLLRYNDTYFQPVLVGGRNMYEVVDAETIP